MDGKASPNVATLEQISPRAWTRCILCFPLKPEQDDHSIIRLLGESLRATARDLPFLAGYIGEVSEKDGKRRLRWQAGLPPQLIVRNHMFPYRQLQQKAFPISGMSSGLFATPAWFPPAIDKLATCVTQLTLGKGGIFLGVSLAHSVADGSTMAKFLQQWASHCKRIQAGGSESLAFPPEVFDKTQLSVLRDGPGTRVEDHPEFILLPEHSPRLSPPRFGRHIHVRLFFFSPQSLVALKESAHPKHCSMPQPEHDWTTTDTALCALIWRSVVAASCSGEDLQRLPQTSVFCTALNARPRSNPPLPTDFMGSAWVVDPAMRLPLLTLLSPNDPPNLADIALTIRRSRETVTPAYLDSLISLIDSLPDPSRLLSLACTDVLRTSGMITSWAKFPIYDYDWGDMLGKCERVRLPNTGLMNGLQVILPALTEEMGGGLEVAIGLEGYALDRLRNDELWNQYADAR